MEKFTHILRQAILDCEVSRYAISRRTGVAESTLSRFVRGERGLSSESIDALMEFLRLEVRPRRKRKGE
jgi:transcriptional regulator with XRE-family HTH domain